MISTRGIGIPDDPLSPYVLASWNRSARLAAELACEGGLGDRVAWEVFCGDVTTVTVDARGRETIHLAAGLEAYRAVYGNRRSRSKRRVRRVGQGTLL